MAKWRQFQSMLASLFEKLIGVGTHAYDEETRRRLRVLNVVAYLIAIVTLGYAFQQIQLGLIEYRPLVLINLGLVVVALMVPFLHKINDIIGGLTLVIAEYFAIYALSSYVGREAGLQIQFFVVPAAAFIILGNNRLGLTALVICAAVVLNIMIWFQFPAEKALLKLSADQIGTLYINAAVTTGLLIGGAVYYAYAQLERAQKRIDALLRNSLPSVIVDRLEQNENTQVSDRFDDVSVLFLDLAGFTPMALKIGPQKTVELLDSIITELDSLARNHGVEKIKTIGDAYMAVCGAPITDPDHGEKIMKFAIAILPVIKKISSQCEENIGVRIGIASGPIIGGIIGRERMSYDIWGHTVNVAARMESHGEVGRIHVSDDFKNKLAETYDFVPANIHSVKGLGKVQSWFLEANV